MEFISGRKKRRAALAVRGLPLLKTPKGTTLASQRPGIRGMSVINADMPR
jgi:hypothetical protein